MFSKALVSPLLEYLNPKQMQVHISFAFVLVSRLVLPLIEMRAERARAHTHRTQKEAL